MQLNQFIGHLDYQLYYQGHGAIEQGQGHGRQSGRIRGRVVIQMEPEFH